MNVLAWVATVFCVVAFLLVLAFCAAEIGAIQARKRRRNRGG